MRTIIISFSIILTILSCSEPKEITDLEIYNFDNYYVYHEPNLEILDSLIEEFPKSDYPFGMKLIYLAHNISPDSSIHLGNEKDKFFKYGTFRETSFSLSVDLKQRKWRLDSSLIEYYYKEAFYIDKNKINIWCRIEKGNAFRYIKKYSLSFKYYQEALDINPDNPLIKRLLLELSLERKDTNEAKYYLDDIPTDYKPEIMNKYRTMLK